MPIYDPCVILKPESLHMAATARVDSFCKLEGGEGIWLGEHVHIASYAHLNIGGGKLVVEDYAAIASGGKVVTGSNSIEALSCSAVAPADMQRIVRGKVVIGKYAVLFVNATVLPGVTIGEGAVVGAGALIRHNVPAWEIWAGNPAKKIGTRQVNGTGRTVDMAIPNMPGDWSMQQRGGLILILNGNRQIMMRLPGDIAIDHAVKIAWLHHNYICGGNTEDIDPAEIDNGRIH